MNVSTKNLVCAVLLGSAGLAQADLVTNLGTLNPSTHTSFANAAVAVGSTVVGPIAYNFLDKFNFSLVTPADVASIIATINFSAGAGGVPLFGISDLQVNLRQVLPSSSLLLVSWLTVTTPAPGLQQVVALTPSSTLSAGDYSLAVRGVLAAPGSYSGSLIAMTPAAVPVPAALPLLILGLGALGGGAGVRRRREPTRNA